jgi:hypothetical protein
VTGIEELVAPRVPEIVTAAKGIEEPSATRFHFLKCARGITGGRVYVTKGICKAGRKLPSLVTVVVMESSTTGNKILPVDVTLTRLLNSVVVVVNTAAVEILCTTEDMTVAMVGMDVVRRASVMVVTGNESVGASVEKTEMLLPRGAWTVPLIDVTKGFGPPRILTGPDSARRALGLFTSVH